jgi:hypothetical protein
MLTWFAGQVPRGEGKRLPLWGSSRRKAGEEAYKTVYTKTAKPISYNKKNNKKQKNK